MATSQNITIRRPSRRIIAGVALCLVTVGALWLYGQESKELTEISVDLHAKLEQQIVPFFKLHNVNADEDLERLNQLIQQSTQPHPVRLVCWRDTFPPTGFYRPMTARDSDASMESVVSDRINGKAMTLDLPNVSLDSLLHYVEKFLGCSIGQKGDTLYLIEGKGAFGPFVVHEYTVPPSYFTTASGTRTSPEEFLRSNGVRFYEGAKAEILSNGHLRVRNLNHEIFQCDLLLHSPNGGCL